MRRTIEHIMLVDDEDDHHFITKVTLKKAGFQGRLDAFHSAEDALRHIRSGEVPPDLFLVDINMPGTTGFDLLRILESEGLLPDERSLVVMCSSSNRPTDIEAARRFRSVDDYVEKSFDLEQFERLSDAFMRKRA
ncbi:MAG: response regulator [Flavobacteriales bacterium]|nr:response regulator [Flavobacteriales bacterium]